MDNFRKNAKEKHKKTPFYPQTFVLFHKTESYPHLYTIEYLYRKTNRTAPLFLFLFCRKKIHIPKFPQLWYAYGFLTIQFASSIVIYFIPCTSRLFHKDRQRRICQINCILSNFRRCLLAK